MPAPVARGARLTAALAAIAGMQVAIALLWRRFNAAPPAVGLEFPFDVVRYYVPMAEAALARLAEGELPLWNPSGCAGLPLLATLQVGVFHPGTWLGLWLAPERAIPLVMAFETGLGAVFGWWLFRAWHHGHFAAAAAGVLFAFSCLLGQAFWPPALATIVWLPWLLLCVEKLSHSLHWRWWLGLALGTTLQFLGGYPQFLVYSFYLIIPVAIVRLVQRTRGADVESREALRRAAAMASAVALGLGLAGAQLLPTRELVGQSARAEKLGAEDVHYLAEDKPPTDIAGYLRNAVDPSPKLISLGYGTGTGYLGVATLVLAAAGLVARRRDALLWTLVAAGAAGLLLSQGHTGVSAPLYRVFAALPTGGMFRSPERLQLLTLLATIAAAAAGTDLLRRGVSEPASRRAVLAAAGALAAACAIFGAAGSAWRAGLALALLASAILFEPGRAVRAALQAGLAALLLFDVWGATGAHGSFRALPVQWARELHLWGHRAVDAQQLDVLAAEVGDARIALHGFDTTPVDGLRRLLCYEPLALAPWFDLQELAKEHAPPGLGDSLDDAIYDVASVRIVVAGKPKRALRDEEIRGLGPHALEMFRRPAPAPEPHPLMGIYRLDNPDALPRAYVVSDYEVRSATEARLAVARSDFDFQRSVLVDRALQVPPGRRAPLRPARIVEDAPERVEIQAHAPRGGVLVLTDSDYPGWEASIDGERLEIARANGLFRAVAIPPGHHRVVFEYRPASLRRGIALSFVSALGLAAIPLWHLARRRASPDRATAARGPERRAARS